MEEDAVQNPEEKKKKRGGRGRDAVFRIMLRNQVRMIDIADSKANMVIGLNSVILSVIISMISTKFMFGNGLEGVFLKEKIYALPILILVISCLISIVFAILAAKPVIIRPKKEKAADPDEKPSILFFENFYNKTQKAFMGEFRQFLSSDKDIYDNFTIELYNQGKVLHRKYWLITISYTVFMVGFVAGVIAFIFMWLIY